MNAIVYVLFLTGRMTTMELVDCTDGDTCRLRSNNSEIIIRLKDIDTPEIRGRCQSEKRKAKIARDITRNWMGSGRARLFTEGKRGYYGRLLVWSPELSKLLKSKGVARDYNGRRRGWC